MKTIMYLAALTLLFFGCSKSEEANVQPTVASTYNTTVEQEQFTRTNGEQAIRVRVANNSMLDSIHPNVSTAYIAVLSFQNLDQAERSAVSAADIEVLDNGNLKESYTYQLEPLKKAINKHEVFNQLSSYLVRKNFKAIDKARDTKDVPNDISAALTQKLKFLEKNYGKLKGFKTFGLAEQGDENGRAYQFQAYLEFEKRSVPYFFYLDVEAGKDKWLGFSIKN